MKAKPKEYTFKGKVVHVKKILDITTGSVEVTTEDRAFTSTALLDHLNQYHESTTYNR